MSDEPQATLPEPEVAQPVTDQEAELAKLAAYQARVANINKAREAKLRAREQRRAEALQAAERRIGSQERRFAGGNTPTEAKRAEATREPSLPDSHIPTRRRRVERSVAGTDIQSWEKKPGWDYTWWPARILNQPVDRSTLRSYEDDGGWRPVLARDMPSRADRNAPPDSPIEMEAMLLYTRPMSLTQEAKQEDQDIAYRQQHDRMIAAASGQSAIRGEEGIPNRRGVRSVPVEISIVGEAG